MPPVAIAAIGAVAGAIYAAGAGMYPIIGLVVGWSIGSALGNMINPPKPPKTSFGLSGALAGSPRFSAGVLENTVSNELPIPVGYGKNKLAGNIIWQSEPGTVIKRLVVLAEGECDSISDVRINDIPIDELPGCSYNFYKGTSTQVVDSRATGKVYGLRYISYLALTLTASEKLKGGNPTVTGILKGLKVSVWNGSAWTTTKQYSNNPAACIRDFLINNRYAVGLDSLLLDSHFFSQVYNYANILLEGRANCKLDGKTLVSIGLDSTETTIGYNGFSGSNGYFLKIDSEIIKLGTKGATEYTSVTRGYQSTAAFHKDDSKITECYGFGFLAQRMDGSQWWKGGGYIYLQSAKFAVDVANIPASGILLVGNEKIQYTAWDATHRRFTVPSQGRGYSGTAITSHDINSLTSVISGEGLVNDSGVLEVVGLSTTDTEVKAKTLDGNFLKRDSYIKIDDEFIFYEEFDGALFKNCLRGQNNTTATEHQDEAVIKEYYKRFELDYVIDCKRPALDILNDMLATFGGYFIFSGSKLKLGVQKAMESAQDFTMDNILEGSFSYNYVSKNEKPNKLKVQYIDPSYNYTKIYTISEDRLDQEDKGEVNELEMALLGISRFNQASRMAEQYLDISKFNGIYSQFKVGIEAIHCEVGDIVTVSHDVPSWTKKEFQLLQASEEENDEMLLIFKEYNSSIFRDEQGSYVEVFDYGKPRNPYLPVANVTNVSAVEYNYYRDSELVNCVDTAWTPPGKEEMEYLDYYLIEVSIDGGEFRGVDTINAIETKYRLENCAINKTYQVRVKTVSINNVVSDGTISDTILVTGLGAILKHYEFQLLNGILSDELFKEWTNDYNVNYYRKVIALKTERDWSELESLYPTWEDLENAGVHYDKPLVATKESYVLTNIVKKELDYMEYSSDALAQAAYVTDAPAAKELDYMEYASDALARAAYVTDGAITAYGSDECSGGTPTASRDQGAPYEASSAFDDNTATFYYSGGATDWIQYQLAAGKVVQQYTIQARDTTGVAAPKDWTFKGSNNGSDWDTLDTVTNETAWANGEKRTFTFSNSTSYTFYRLDITASNGTYIQIAEIEMMEATTWELTAYSEDTIKEEGDYSLKGIAVITDSLNDTLTRTVDPTIDLSGINTFLFYIYASRTGSNIKVGLRNNTYGSDILSGGTASADSFYDAARNADKACDNNLTSYWQCSAGPPPYPHWWKYDLGDGNEKTVQKLRIKPFYTSSNAYIKDFKLQGSNNDSDWDDLLTDQVANANAWDDFTFSNSTAYRYYRIYATNNWVGNGWISVYEFEMMEKVTTEVTPNVTDAGQWQKVEVDISAVADADKDAIDGIIVTIMNADAENTFYIDDMATLLALQCYSEPTIKKQGDYSLKAIATTGSLNKALTRTVSPTIDLSNKDIIKFWVYSSRTGENIQLQIHDSGGTTTTHNIDIAVANAWQIEEWDISGVANADKDAINQIVIKILNADAEDIFYMDDIFGEGWDDFDLEAARQVTILSTKVTKGGGILKEYCRYKVNSADIWSDWIEMPAKVFCRYFQVKLELQVLDVNLDKIKVVGYNLYCIESF